LSCPAATALETPIRALLAISAARLTLLYGQMSSGS